MHLRLAYYNIRQRKMHTAYIVINIFIILMILMVWQTITYSLNRAQDDIIYGRKSQCCIQIRNAEKYEKLAYLLLDNSNYNVEIQKIALIDWDNTLEKDNWSFVNIKHVSLKINDIIYNGMDDKSFDFGCDIGETKSVSFGTSVIIEGQVFSQNDLQEYYFENSNAYDNGLICGRMPENNGEFIMTDYMLNCFGIAKEAYDDIVGQKADFSCDGESIISNIRLVGIIDSNIFRCENLVDYPQIILKDTEIKSDVFKYDIIHRISFEDFADMEMFYTYLDNLDLEIDYSSDSRELTDRLYILSSSQKLISKLLIIYGWLMIIILVLNLLRVIYNDMAEKRSNYGMMIIMGMNREDVILLCCLEIIYDIIIAALLSGVTSFAVVKVLIKVLEMSSGAELLISFRFFAFSAFVDLIILGFICIVVITSSWITFNRKSPYKMMTGE